MRLFVSIEVPEVIRQKIWGRLSQKIPAQGFSVVAGEKLHYTLCFIGEASKSLGQEIMQKLCKVKHREFEVEISGIGKFGNRVLWLGAVNGKKEMEALARDISEKLGMQGESFSCHLTIARNKGVTKEEFAQVVEMLSIENFCETFSAKSFLLMESELSSSGSTYKKLLEVRLSE